MNLLTRRLLAQEERLAQVDAPYKHPGAFKLSSFWGDGIDFPDVPTMAASVQKVCRHLDEFYAPARPVSRVKRDEDVLTFDSAVPGDAHCETVHARVFGWKESRKRAVIVVPHWSSREVAYARICKLLSLFGLATFLITLPHHGKRSNGDPVANDFLNADLGAAIRSVRQSVSDVRSLVTVLHDAGFQEVNLVGVSLGSCIGGLVAEVEPRIVRSVLLLTAGDFAETVWFGSATAHIRSVIEANITLQDLQEVWSVISPINFVDRCVKNNSRILIISGRLDKVVPLNLASEFVNKLRDAGVEVRWHVLPCGHFTLGALPYSVVSFLMTVRHLLT